MVTNITIHPLTLNKEITQKIFKHPEFKNNIEQIKQAAYDKTVIVCDLEVPKINMADLKHEIKRFTGANIVNFTYDEK